MSLRLVPAVDSGLNMTPMIDIVFQLILFFMFNLRFRALDYRIDSELPRERGMRVGPPVDILPAIRATLVRLDPEDAHRARTKLKIAGTEWVLPDLSGESESARDAMFVSIQARLHQLRTETSLPGEIVCPEPTGSFVPHGDVVRVLDSFLGAGITDVNFEGAKAPVSHKR